MLPSAPSTGLLRSGLSSLEKLEGEDMQPIEGIPAVGFVGLGVMGSDMASWLLRKRHRLHVYARRDEAALSVTDQGAQRAVTLAGLGRTCKVVLLCLSDDPAVEAVLFAPQGLVEGLRSGSVVVDLSTIAASSARHFSLQLADRGIFYLDAPVSGGQTGAEAGTLTCMIGGPASAVEAVREILAAFCSNVRHVGESGAGQIVKACNQVAAAGALLGVADALLLARTQGVDPNVMREVLLGGTARSFVLEKDGQRLIDGEFTPGFRARLMRKDLRIALEAAERRGAQLQSTAIVERLLAELCDSGGGELDWSRVGVLPS